MNQTDTIIPIYNLRACQGAKDFAVAHLKPFKILGAVQVPHRHEGYTMSLLLKGRVILYIDFERYVVESPAVICVGPDQVNQYELAEEAEMICLSFNHDFFVGEMRRWVACWECMFNQVILNPKQELMNELLAYVDLISKEFDGNKPKKDIIIRNLLNALIINVARLRTNIASVMQLDASTNKLVEQFKSYVDANFRNKTQVSQYAEMLHVTPGHLNDVIKDAVGKTAKQIIDEKRITEVKRLLFWADYSLKEIAGLLSFENDSYFNRFFKKHTSYTPSLYQRTIREKYN